MLYLMSAFSIFFVSYMLWKIKKAIDFFKLKNKYSAELTADKLYLFVLLITSIIYPAIIAEALISVFVNFNYYFSENPIRLPFAIYAFPLIIISCNTIIEQGLFAYNEEYLIGYKNVLVPFSSVNIKNVKSNKLSRTKATIIIIDESSKNKKEIIIRTSNDNFKLLQNQLLPR